LSNKIHDEYATKPRTIKPIIRANEFLGKLQIDLRRIETTPYYLRTDTNKSINPYAQSQRDRINNKDTERKIQRTHKNLHGRFQKRRKSWVRGDNTRPKV
jgi:hypothetical protein